MSKRDLLAGIRARQRSAPFLPEEPSGYTAIEVPVALDSAIEAQVLLLNRAAEAAGQAGFTKRRLIELALRELVQTPPAEILARDRS
jgi:hypothetical protein